MTLIRARTIDRPYTAWGRIPSESNGIVENKVKKWKY